MILQASTDFIAVCRLSPASEIPAWATRGSFFSITRTPEELSIACSQTDVSADIKAERDWRSLKVQGPLDFSLTGILAALATPLAQVGISIFAVSTFDTDYLLIKDEKFTQAIEVLRQAGHEVRE